METRLTRIGREWVLVLDPEWLERAKIAPDAALQVRAEEGRLVLTSVAAERTLDDLGRAIRRQLDEHDGAFARWSR